MQSGINPNFRVPSAYYKRRPQTENPYEEPEPEAYEASPDPWMEKLPVLESRTQEQPEFQVPEPRTTQRPAYRDEALSAYRDAVDSGMGMNVHPEHKGWKGGLKLAGEIATSAFLGPRTAETIWHPRHTLDQQAKSEVMEKIKSSAALEAQKNDLDLQRAKGLAQIAENDAQAHRAQVSAAEMLYKAPSEVARNEAQARASEASAEHARVQAQTEAEQRSLSKGAVERRQAIYEGVTDGGKVKDINKLQVTFGQRVTQEGQRAIDSKRSALANSYMARADGDIRKAYQLMSEEIDDPDELLEVMGELHKTEVENNLKRARTRQANAAAVRPAPGAKPTRYDTEAAMLAKAKQMGVPTDGDKEAVSKKIDELSKQPDADWEFIGRLIQWNDRRKPGKSNWVGDLVKRARENQTAGQTSGGTAPAPAAGAVLSPRNLPTRK